MKTKDIEADVAYATVRGEYIVPQAPVKSTYQYLMVPKPDSGFDRTVIDTAVNADPENPWKGKVKADPKGSYRTGSAGIKVLAYSDLDENGKPEGDPIEAVVQPRDIGGTWDEYMSLYAHLVVEKARERERTRLIRETGQRLIDITDTVSSLSASYTKGYRDRPDRWHINYEISVGDGADAEYHDHAVQVMEAIAKAVRESARW